MFDCPECSKRLEISEQRGKFIYLACSNKSCKFTDRRIQMNCPICDFKMFIKEQEKGVVLFKCGICTNLEEIRKNYLGNIEID